MRLLLDTHTFLWFIEDSSKLSQEAKKLLESEVELLLSIASLWEMAIKISIGKLTLAEPFHTFIPQQLSKNAIGLLPIRMDHLNLVSSLPFHHRDPFDRLLVAQAITEHLPIVSIDDKFDSYSVKRIWSNPIDIE
ncbi:MAG TPA: type II toxin-antitoxin system VapC family toxin [Blastocatellia bacterium]|nr:type II toxin-antitoxin system VapC family toxin [Blastocatellia bacterium]